MQIKDEKISLFECYANVNSKTPKISKVAL